MEKYLHVRNGVVNPIRNHLSIGKGMRSHKNGQGCGILLKNITDDLGKIRIRNTKKTFKPVPANVVGGFSSGIGKSHQSDNYSNSVASPIPTGGSILHSVRLKHSDYHKQPLEVKRSPNNIRFVI